MRPLLLLFITIPIVEMWLLIEVGSSIGGLATIALVFLTATLGLALLRQQGLSTLLKVNQRMEQGQLPAAEIVEGIMLAVGGALLLTPGFITDAIGFACLLPPSRKLLAAIFLRKGLMRAVQGRAGAANDSFHSASFGPASFHGAEPRGQQSPPADKPDAIVVEGEFRREED